MHARAVSLADRARAQLASAARKVLEREDLTAQQRREMAETLSVRAASSEVETTIDVERDF